MSPDTALLLTALGISLAACLWAGLLALGEEAAFGETLHTLGDAPAAAAARATAGKGGAQVQLHRALHVVRLMLLVVAAATAAAALGWWQRPPLAAAGVLALTIVLTFILGDALPRSAARIAPDLAELALPVARRTLPPFLPLLAPLTLADRRLYALGAARRPLEPVLGAAQRDMLLGIFTIADTTVQEVMTPRLDLVGVDIAASTPDVLAAFRHSEHTRLPVWDGTPDSLMGVVYARDLVPLAMGLADAPARWQDLVRPTPFVPETKTVDSQLRDFQRGPADLAIVVDEFGGTSGLITREDILEEIVGEIRDEHDVEVAPAIQREGDRYSVDGRVTLDELSDALGTPIVHPDVSTVGGLVYSVLGRVPRAGEELTLDGYRVVVERVDRRRVTRVTFQRQR